MLAHKMFVQHVLRCGMGVGVDGQGQDRHAGDLLEHNSVVYGLRGIPAPGEGAVAGAEHTGHIQRVDAAGFERLDDDLAGVAAGEEQVEGVGGVLEAVDQQMTVTVLNRGRSSGLRDLPPSVEVLHGDTHLPGEESTASRWEVNPNRRIHVYERCSQFSILQNLPTAYMWSSPMPQRALEQYHLALHGCPAQKQQMRDVLVYPEREPLQPEEQLFVQLLHKQADATIKDSGWKKI